MAQQNELTKRQESLAGARGIACMLPVYELVIGPVIGSGERSGGEQGEIG